MKAPCHPRHRFVEACDPNSPSARKAFPNYCLTYLDHSLQKPSWFGTLRFEGAVAIASWSCSGRFGFGVLRINEKNSRISRLRLQGIKARTWLLCLMVS